VSVFSLVWSFGDVQGAQTYGAATVYQSLDGIPCCIYCMTAATTFFESELIFMSLEVVSKFFNDAMFKCYRIAIASSNNNINNHNRNKNAVLMQS